MEYISLHLLSLITYYVCYSYLHSSFEFVIRVIVILNIQLLTYLEYAFAFLKENLEKIKCVSATVAAAILEKCRLAKLHWEYTFYNRHHTAVHGIMTSCICV